MTKAGYHARPARLLLLTQAPKAAPNACRFADRIAAPLPKIDPDTGEPLPLRSCPYEALMSGRAAATPGAGDLLLEGTEYTVQPGTGGILVIMLVRRHQELSHAAFAERWLHGHARFGNRIGASGYRQLHVDDDRVFNGVGMVFFRDPDHMAAARAAPEVARDATRDEITFIDHSQSMLAMFRFR
jgi:catechol 2,3-dioxygenase-like lactoylglutathione lyase family enzyme